MLYFAESGITLVEKQAVKWRENMDIALVLSAVHILRMFSVMTKGQVTHKICSVVCKTLSCCHDVPSLSLFYSCILGDSGGLFCRLNGFPGAAECVFAVR